MESSAERKSAGPRATILVCEDESLLRKTLAHDLESAGYAVLEAIDGEAACKVLGGSQVDLLITDVRLPGISGWDVVAFTRDHIGALPVIVMSAYGLEGESRDLKQAFGCAFLDKPFPMATMRSEVERALGTREGAGRKFRSDA